MSSEGGPSPKKSKTIEEKLGLSQEDKCYFGEQPTAAPGLFRILRRKDIHETINELGNIKIVPVTLNPKIVSGASTSHRALSTALSGPTANLAFSSISSCVSASIVEKAFPLDFLLPSLQESLQGDSTGFVKIYSLISHISDIYYGEEKGWKESYSGALEINDQQLWSKLCGAVIEGGSAVFKECTIDAETNEVASSGSLPHGDVDVVAGQLDNSGEINWTFGVQLLDVDEVYELYSPVGVSNKTRKTLATDPPNTQVVVETLAFTEVLNLKDTEKPVIFFAGTWEAFRPFIRIKKLDLLLTTGQSIVWWDSKKNVPNLTGITLLIILMLGVSSPGYNLEIVTDRVRKLNLPVTGWNQYYAEHQRKYARTLVVKKKVETPSNPVKPRENDREKIFLSASEREQLRKTVKK